MLKCSALPIDVLDNAMMQKFNNLFIVYSKYLIGKELYDNS